MSGKYDDGEPDGPQSSKAIIERQIAESAIRARKMINRYTDLEAQIAIRGQEPTSHPKLYEQLKDVHVACMDAFTQIREYVKHDTDHVWNQKVIGTYDGSPVLFGGKDVDEWQDGEQVESPHEKGALYLEEFEGKIEREKKWEYDEYEGLVSKTEIYPALLDVGCYKSIVNLIFDVLKQTDFSPQTPTPAIESEPLL